MARRARTPQEIVASIVGELPGATLTHPFGDEVDVWKVGVRTAAGQVATGGKMFAITSPERRFVTLKVDPDRGAELVRDHDFVIPGYHTNKRHWISVMVDEVTVPGLLEDLLEDAYELVVAALPARARFDVDPDRFPLPVRGRAGA
jgi:predicted DNA-binding protein (MmcQ/YjbR family)